MLKKFYIDITILFAFVLLGMLMTNIMTLVMGLSMGINIATITSNPRTILDQMNSQQLMIAQLSSHVFTLILPAFVFTKLRQSQDNIQNSQFKASDFINYSILFILVLPIVSYSAYINKLIPLPEWMHSSEAELREMITKLLTFNGIPDLLLAIITIGIIPGIGEEWIFRRILQTKLQSIIKNKWIVLIITASIFSAIHMQFEGFIPRFILGFILGYIFLKTKNIIYPMILHGTFNSIQVIASYYIGAAALDAQLSTDKAPMQWYMILPFSLIFVYYFYITEKKQTINHES